MNDTPTPTPKPLMTFVFDEVTVLTQKAEAVAHTAIKPPKANDPILTVEVDEMTEFVVKAVPAGGPATR